NVSKPYSLLAFACSLLPKFGAGPAHRNPGSVPGSNSRSARLYVYNLAKEPCMRLSAELRWFWNGEPAKEFDRWFVEAGQSWPHAKPAKTRLDDYLVDHQQSALSIKKRSSGSIVVIKGLITARDQTLRFANCTAQIELWAKWPISALDLSSGRVVAIEK